MVQEGPKLCPTGPKKPGGNGTGKHPLLHPGWDKMLSVLQPRVYWKSMWKDVDRLVWDCELCQIKTL